jgi:exopolyphosphatase/guanosine-5'-triphosphate,3'-diphosphate pyrophosphatase
MRVATIDIGTNTVLLLVAEGGGNGALRAVAERATITRLGQGVDKTRVLAPDAIARTTACLESYAQTIRELGVERVAVVGTSAMRDARGGDAIVRAVRETMGVEARVIPGDEEARLTFRGALSGMTIASDRAVVFDIGGGSTEIVFAPTTGAFAPTYARSIDVGSVRLTERHGEDLEALSRAARDAFADVPAVDAGTIPVGIAGTVTTIAAVSLSLAVYDGAKVHGHVMSRAALESVVRRLASVDVETRRTIAGMEPKRADVIVAGGIIAVSLLEHWGVDAIRVSDRGVRWGLAEEIAFRDDSSTRTSL